MFRSNLLKLSVTLVLLVATAFASVTAVAAEGSNTIIQVKAASPAVEVTADEWYERSPDTGISANADLSDYFQRHPDTRISVVSATDLSDYFQRHPDTRIPVNTAADASIPSSLDNPNGHWIGPETVSAALGQSSSILSGDAVGSLMRYGPPGR